MAAIVNFHGNIPMHAVKERTLDVRVLSESDIPAWSDLLAVAFNRSSEDMAALIQWMMTGWGMTAYGVWDGAILAAQYSCLHTRIKLPDVAHSLPVGMSVNMATHPDYRGQGLIKHAAAPVYEALKSAGVVAGVGFSNAAGVKVDQRSKGYGYQVVGRLHASIAFAPIKAKSSPDFYLTPYAPLLDELDMSADDIHFDATAQHIRHRFGHHPFRRYHYGVWQDRSGIRGVVVFQETKMLGLPTVSLLAAYSQDMDGLLSHWVGSLTRPHLIHALTTPNSRVGESLARQTWGAALPWQKSPYYLTVKPLSDQTPPELLNFDRWQCIGGDVL